MALPGDVPALDGEERRRLAGTRARANKLRGTVSGNGFSFDGSSTAANGWVLGYAYSLSKRSSIYAYGTIVDNDTNARYTGASAAGIGPNAGGDPRYIGVGLRHLF